jgi:molybdate transport system substrate-binding protein
MAGLALAAAFGAAACSRRSPPSGVEPLRVAAAADLSFAFEELGSAYEKTTGQKVVLSFGATGLLERQIVEGAPFDIFAAADVSFVEDAIEAGACASNSKQVYAVGKLAIVAAPGSAFVPTSVSDLADPRITRVAIANPEHAPYGRAARQSLERAGVWTSVEPKLVYGENVHQALEFAESGNADAAIVALSLVIGRRQGVVSVPPDLHDPIEQALAVCARSSAAARAAESFCAYVMSPAGRAVLGKYGFSSADAIAARPETR